MTTGGSAECKIHLSPKQIPSLLRLKRCANVTFAGVDSPEDILDHTHQELFHSGGFVVSDDKVLETVTIGKALLLSCTWG